ncbi:hypothetical protein FQZ97_1149920 [compost metagenome]
MAFIEVARPRLGNHRDHGVVAQVAAAIDVGGAHGENGFVAIQVLWEFQVQTGHDYLGWRWSSMRPLILDGID